MSRPSEYETNEQERLELLRWISFLPKEAQDRVESLPLIEQIATFRGRTMASEPQLRYAARLGVILPVRCDKRQAMVLIDRHLKASAKAAAAAAASITDEQAGFDFLRRTS